MKKVNEDLSSHTLKTIHEAILLKHAVLPSMTLLGLKSHGILERQLGRINVTFHELLAMDAETAALKFGEQYEKPISKKVLDRDLITIKNIHEASQRTKSEGLAAGLLCVDITTLRYRLALLGRDFSFFQNTSIETAKNIFGAFYDEPVSRDVKYPDSVLEGVDELPEHADLSTNETVIAADHDAVLSKTAVQAAHVLNLGPFDELPESADFLEEQGAEVEDDGHHNIVYHQASVNKDGFFSAKRLRRDFAPTESEGEMFFTIETSNIASKHGFFSAKGLRQGFVPTGPEGVRFLARGTNNPTQ